jgi:hypothetical protein
VEPTSLAASIAPIEDYRLKQFSEFASVRRRRGATTIFLLAPFAIRLEESR